MLKNVNRKRRSSFGTKQFEKKNLDKYRSNSSFAIFYHSMPSAELLCVPLRKHLESLSKETALRWL